MLLQSHWKGKPLVPTLLPETGFHVLLRPMDAPENPESMEAIAYRLELVRIALSKRNKTEMAASIGVGSSTWTEYTGGEEWPKSRARIAIDPAIRLCRRYGVTLDWLYRGNAYGMPPEVARPLDKAAQQLASKGRRRNKTT